MQQAYLFAVIGALTALSAWLWQRERTASRRATSLRQLLDGADALEARLHDYKARMQRLRGLLTQLPPDMTGSAMLRVDADAQVQHALRDMLAHRLWIQRESATASQQALDQAVLAIERSGDQLAQQLRLLDAVGDELQAAGRGLRSAYQEASAAQATAQRRDGGDGPRIVGDPPTSTRH